MRFGTGCGRLSAALLMGGLLMGGLLIGGLLAPTPAEAQLGPLERLVMPGPVARSHADIEDDCDACHVRFDRQSQRELCLGCHDRVAEDLATGSGFHGRSPDGERTAAESCAGCHADHEGRDADILGLDRESFDHALARFALRGRHEDLDCESCHEPQLSFHDAPTECVGCHAEDDRHRGNLGEQCAACHSETSWTDARFDHHVETDYALTGAHVELACSACHVDERYVDTSDRCVACHASDDAHMGTNGSECRSCHTTADWADVRFDHFEVSGFALAGGHADIRCDACHVGDKLENAVPTDCNGCHVADDAHQGRNGPVCDDCHRATAWLEVTFDHARDTRFALNGVHADVGCAACHVDPVAVALPGTVCIDCHAGDDPHEGQLGDDCASCHFETSFVDEVRFDHDLTRFPLLGRHDHLACDACHESHAFHDAPGRCADCHADEDAHAGRLGPDCGLCHTPAGWPAWIFDHDVQTAFVLDGAHEDTDCLACHRDPLDAAPALASDCASCHRADDVHRGEFGRDCKRCHTTRSFESLRPIR